jgi:hypothetical protein
MRVRYRLWDSNDWHTGTVINTWTAGPKSHYVDIKRDGYREVTVMPLSKFADPTLLEVIA